MDYKGFVRSLDTPAGYVAPTELTYLDIRARAIGREDLHDVAGLGVAAPPRS